MNTKRVLLISSFFILVFGAYAFVHFSAQASWHKNAFECNSVKSCIIESSCIDDVLKYTSLPKTLVILDIDNTLVRTETVAGGDQWFYNQVEQRMAAGMDLQTAIMNTLPSYFSIQKHIWYYPVEETTVSVLRSLVETSVSSVVLTARGDEPLMTRTIEQLAHADIVLNEPMQFGHEYSFALDRPLVVKEGIIFCHNNDKGKVLKHLFDTFGYKPETIVFVDDKLPNVLAVEKACLEQNISFVGIRYGYLDEWVSQYDAQQAYAECQEFAAQGIIDLNDIAQPSHAVGV